RAARRLSSDPRIVSLEPSSLEDVFANIGTLGELTGHERGAGELLEQLQNRISSLRQRTGALPKSRVLVLEWTDPPMGPGHWTPGLAEDAGGMPVLAFPGANSKALDWSDISAADPGVIIVSPCGFDVAKTQGAIAELQHVPEWTALRAVREGRVRAVDGNAYVNRPGPRLVDTAEIFASILHPEAA